MVMWQLKKCPRCGGDFFIEKDIYGWYQQCLQCSYRQELKDINEFKKQMAQGETVNAGSPNIKNEQPPEPIR